MFDLKLMKGVAPSGKDLSDAVGLILEDHDDELDADFIAREINAEHPTWRLSERRVNRAVKQYRKSLSKPEVDEDVEAPLEGMDTTQKSPAKKPFSPARSLRRLFSTKNRRKFEETDDVPDTASDSPPAPEPVSEGESTAGEESPVEEEEEPTVAEETEKEEEPEPEPEPEPDVIPTEEKVNENTAYETDNEEEENSHDCFTACAIM